MPLIQDFPFLKSKTIKKLIKYLSYSHHEFYFVGGAVRDSLIGLKIKDFDIASNLTPEQNLTNLNKQNLLVIPTGIKHGTITLIIDKQEFQITTLRSDVNPTGRHSAVEWTSSLKKDSNRRDFTINALYLNPINKKLYDFHNGQKDLLNKNLIFIGNPNKRIQEDYLRILRYFRFFGTYSNIEPNSSTIEAICQNKHKLINLSKERISQEILKIFTFNNIKKTIQLLLKTNTLSDFLNINEENINNIETLQSLIKELEIQDKSDVLIITLSFLIDATTFPKENSALLILKRKSFNKMCNIIKLKELLLKLGVIEYTVVCDLLVHYALEEVIFSLIVVSASKSNLYYHIKNIIIQIKNISQNPMPISGKDLLEHNIANENNIKNILLELKKIYWYNNISTKEEYLKKAKEISQISL